MGSGELVEEVVDGVGVEEMDGRKCGGRTVWGEVKVIFVACVHVSR